MKENWMNKLIELLNEFELKQVENSEWLDVSKLWIMDWTLHYYNNYKDELVFDNIDLLIISARYWFIQRLVKHFMFDMTKIDARIALSDFNATDRMLMALAISEDPITLLVECLKTEWTETIE